MQIFLFESSLRGQRITDEHIFYNRASPLYWFTWVYVNTSSHISGGIKPTIFDKLLGSAADLTPWSSLSVTRDHPSCSSSSRYWPSYRQGASLWGKAPCQPWGSFLSSIPRTGATTSTPSSNEHYLFCHYTPPKGAAREISTRRAGTMC